MIINQQALLKAQPIKGMMGLKVRDAGPTSYGLSEAGYDITIAQSVGFFKYAEGPAVGRRGVCINSREHQNGRFVLASALEKFQMPKDLLGVVHDKSTWARKGLSVFNTVIEPGWHGFLTLELVYHGEEDLFIPKGSGIAQVLFHKVTESVEYNGKYQNQPSGPVQAR